MQAQIKPVDVFPGKADVLGVDSFYGFPPSYRWSLKQSVVTEGTPESGNPGEDGYIPAVEPITNYVELRAGNDSFSKEQWDKWTTQSDDSYPLQVAASNLGVTLL